MGKRPNRGASTLRWFELPGVELAVQPLAAPSYANSLQNKAAGKAGEVTEGVRPTWTPWSGWEFDWQAWLVSGITAKNGFSILVSASGANDRPIMGSPNLYVQWGSGSIKGVGSNYISVAVTPKPRNLGICGTNLVADGNILSTAMNGTGISGLIYIGSNGSGSRHIGQIFCSSVFSRTLTPAEVWLASQQMAHCELPQYSVWARQQNYWLPPAGGWQAAWAQGINAQIGVN